MAIENIDSDLLPADLDITEEDFGEIDIISSGEEAEFEVSAVTELVYEELIEIEDPDSVDSCSAPVIIDDVAETFVDALGCTINEKSDGVAEELAAIAAEAVKDSDLVDQDRIDEALAKSGSSVDSNPVFLFEPGSTNATTNEPGKLISSEVFIFGQQNLWSMFF